MAFTSIKTSKFNVKLIEEGSWGHRDLGKSDCEMDLRVNKDKTSGCIIWNYTRDGHADETVIGLTFEAGALIDYDGTFSLPAEAVSLMESAGFTVGEDFR
jgi:hypothetical protein